MRRLYEFHDRLLDPEKAVNWSIGFDYTPSGFLTGLNLQVMYYIVKINGILRNFGNPTTTRFNPSIDVSPLSMGGFRATGALRCARQDAWAAHLLQEVVAKVLSHPEIEVPSSPSNSGLLDQ